ncbi:uncharacterized protein (TIGR01777 family) [Pedobacter sp. UYP30]|uniref:TIGR01777 family oxidoreductase n=1 Tax=Pedobacter sp. UYP30 TaxID=1756400 RepID=UPI0033961008
MENKVLITGGTGLIGRKLIDALLATNYQVAVLARKPTKIKSADVFLWDVEKQQIDETCFENVHTIIHLAGAPVVEEKWTTARKQAIINSRVDSTKLLYNSIRNQKDSMVKNFISASAVGFYGDCEDEILTEERAPGYGFLADCCKLWEQAVEEGEKLGFRVVKLRTGIVLSTKGGALPSFDKPIKMFVGAALGTGKQWTPWIHIDDLVAMYVESLTNPTITGSYNACAPFPVTNKEMTRQIAKQLHRPFWPIKVPKKAIELLMGERAEAILMSSNTSAQKILDAGFNFKFARLADALKNLYNE